MALLPVADAIEQILRGVDPLPVENIGLSNALGRVLAADLVAPTNQPPNNLSAMDGYAVRGDDVVTSPVTLKVIGEAAAGHPFAKKIGPGECARIFTGGVLPRGTDTVVIQENTTRDGDRVTITEPAKRGRHVRHAGIDFKQDDVLLKTGHRLTDRDLMLAAGMNYPSLKVYRAPRVAILGTGDELVPPGSQLHEGQIVHSSGYALAALVRSESAQVVELGVAKDRLEHIVACIRQAREAKADVLLTTGGASVGEHDLVQKALAAEGLSLSFWQIAMRPGKPMMHGRLGVMHVLGVPGNPVSSYVCAFLFLLPLVRRLSGRKDLHAERIAARLGRALPQNDKREEYMRATLETKNGELIATPFPNQDSSLMAPLAKADCLVVRERFAPAAEAGAPCVIVKLGL
jgi:molybdopterin molybdotransferase